MDANHARPLVAFWLLALIAAVITVIGLRASGADVTVRAGAPSPVSGTGSPELVLGGVIRAQPTASRAPLTWVDEWSRLSALRLASGQWSATPGVRATAQATVAGPKASVPTDTSAVASARATPTPTAPGKSAQDHGKSSDTATTTATPTDGVRGKGRSQQSADDVTSERGKSAGH